MSESPNPKIVPKVTLATISIPQIKAVKENINL